MATRSLGTNQVGLGAEREGVLKGKIDPEPQAVVMLSVSCVSMQTVANRPTATPDRTV